MSVIVGIVLPNETHVRKWLALAALAVVCTTTGIIRGGPSGDFFAGAGMGVLAMLLALHVASRRPAWGGVVPGLLGGMAAAAIGMGWEKVASWSGLTAGVITILASVIIDREAAAHRASKATE